MSDTQEKREQKPIESIAWRAAEYEFSPKRTEWFVAVLAVAGALAIFALWQRNFFFAVFVIVAAGTLVLFARRRPRILDFQIDEKAIRIGDTSFPLESFDGFAVHERPGKLDRLVLRRRSSANPFLNVPLDSSLAVRARNTLQKTLTEFEHRESLVDTFADLLGF